MAPAADRQRGNRLGLLRCRPGRSHRLAVGDRAVHVGRPVISEGGKRAAIHAVRRAGRPEGL